MDMCHGQLCTFHQELPMGGQLWVFCAVLSTASRFYHTFVVTLWICTLLPQLKSSYTIPLGYFEIVGGLHLQWPAL